MSGGRQGSLHYPVFLNLKEKKCVVVGGGQVALRKAKVFLEHGASIKVISPALCSELKHLAQNGTIHVLERNYQPGDLKGAFIAVVATSDADTNRKVTEEAKRQGILANVVDDPGQSDFITSSYLRRGNLTIAISTNGKSPALSRKIRTRLEEDFGEEYATLVSLVNEVRSELRQRKVTVSSNVWQEVLDLDWLIKMVQAGQMEEAKATLLSRLGSSGQAPPSIMR